MKKILIIGATSSIAEHCARIWASRGDAIYLVARNEEHIQTIATDLKVRGAEHIATFCIDLNEIDQHATLLNAAENEMNGIDIVLVAHGTLPDQKLCEQNVSETISQIQTNALSTVSLLTLISNRFEAKKEGTIAVISSVAGERGRASNYVYGSAKALLTAFTSGLRQRLYKSNVAVITIKPGFVDTPMTTKFQKGLLWAKPSSIAINIVKAIDEKKDEIYVPKFWWLFIFIIKQIPNILFKKLKL
jgi:decaprenylphospho-beta-D-erythro-pentofuranosid-2-ulose 2-reductase